MNTSDYTLRFKQILLSTMKAFDAFCSQHQLAYMAAYGTVIGAVRHKGLIPWDDDIDVFMDWDNYQRFLNLKAEARKTGYSIIDRKEEGYYLPIAKFADTHTTIWEHKFLPFVFGVYIDIFPLGYVNNVPESRKLWELYKQHSLLLTKAYIRFSWSKQNLAFAVKHPLDFTDYLIQRRRKDYHQRELDVLDGMIAGIREGDYRLYYRSMDDFERSLFKAEWFEKTIRVPFEDFDIPIPADYQEYLTTAYGDYMTPPPVEKQITHHSHYYLNLQEGLSLEEAQERVKIGEKLVF